MFASGWLLAQEEPGLDGDGGGGRSSGEDDAELGANHIEGMDEASGCQWELSYSLSEG